MKMVYEELERKGVIGKMMKVNARGNPIIDLDGTQPGTLVTRPFVEYPKIIRRYSTEGGKPIEFIANSKNEELRLLAMQPDEFGDVPMSPLERERNDLAKQNAEQSKVIGTLQDQMMALMQQVAQLTQSINKSNAENVALGTGAEPIKTEAAAQPAVSGKGIEALVTGRNAAA